MNTSRLKKFLFGIGLLIILLIIVIVILIGDRYINENESMNKDKIVIGDYIENSDKSENSNLTEIWSVEEIKPYAWTEESENEKVIAMKDNKGNIIPLPEGYTISTNTEEDEISEGVVILDQKGNQFVWIPVETDLTISYSSENYSEPTILSYDEQIKINSYYGENYYTISNIDEYQNNKNNIFAYKAHYAEMVKSVNKYNGFYVGRYETTIDGTDIGSKYNTTVLTTNARLEEFNSINISNYSNFYRWWGLYEKQRKCKVTGNEIYVQANMIWGQQWDEMIKCFEKLGLDYITSPNVKESMLLKAGKAEYKNNEEIINDVIYNIYDLRGNAFDFTAEAVGTSYRVVRGGDCFNGTNSAANRNVWFPNANSSNNRFTFSALYKIVNLI